MAGIYLHIPYCKQACHYCDFHFSTVMDTAEDMQRAMLKELRLRIDEAEGGINSIYFGGGTPSILSPNSIREFIDFVRSNASLNPDAEITLEANPDDLLPEKLAAWKEAGINRLSIGIQSFRDSDLKWMNRAHNAEEALRAVDRATNAGFHSLTVDLIYGVPLWKGKEWEENLNHLFSLDINHFSAYILTVEEGTAYGHQVRKGKAPIAPEVQLAHEYELLCSLAQKHGFSHYEISNFARNQHKAQHNSSYWEGTPYLGIGPGAHSFVNGQRRWNVSHNRKYINALLQDAPYFETEDLSPLDRYNESLMTGLRTARGINLEEMNTHFGTNPSMVEPKEWKQALERGQIIREENRFRVAEPFWMIADDLAARFFAV
ncbi:radical SAM family heme chaperone HemW [Sanyastnella coralliicola]|uniref:radical SAM family heme chaperone HemW n=1 Tax=Sanyastnella coralliicola TaxID=3069118 RepID=UPI0027B8D91A|nr:radical SAM family heme chaperone HemW [Longitalea sp. SCSIO 12813]